MNDFQVNKILQNIRSYMLQRHSDKVEEFEELIKNDKLNRTVYFWIDEHICSIDNTEELQDLMKDYFFSIH